MSNTVYTGILTADETNHFILRRNGSGILEENRIWDGYINHWTGQIYLCLLAQIERLRK